MGRSSKWDEPSYFPIGISNPDANPALGAALEKSPESGGDSFSSWDLIGTCRELILHVIDDGYEFDLVTFAIDANSGRFMVSRSFRMLKVDAEDAKGTLATCLALEVPVYPEDETATQALKELLDSLYTDGFEADKDGQTVRFKFTGDRGLSYDPETAEWNIRATESIMPGDVILAAARSNLDLAEISEARSILRHLRDSIAKLSDLLEAETRNENDLQRCLTAYPVLFGIEYKRIIPKYKLGKDYELDYALERTSGLVDLVEIEASTLPLYTKKGNPTSYLVHAEQQVLDWLEWTESNTRMVRDDLPQMMRPQGQVVIGRSADLGESDIRRLQRRNATFQGSLHILTYDDVLARAKVMLAVLSDH